MPLANTVSLVALAALPLSQCLSLAVPSTVPSNASDVIDQAYVGFGIEATSFHLYARKWLAAFSPPSTDHQQWTG